MVAVAQSVRALDCGSRGFAGSIPVSHPSFITHCATMSYNNAPRDINPRGALSPRVYDS